MVASATRRTANSNAASAMIDGDGCDATFRTYWRAAASISSGVAAGWRPRRGVMLRHIPATLRIPNCGLCVEPDLRCHIPPTEREGPQVRTRSAHFSPIMITGAWMLLLVMDGITDASATRRPSTPRTRNDASTTAIGSLSGPILAVPHG